jgi:hypothetical protein
MSRADRAREAAVGALYEALEVEATVTAEYEGASVGRIGRGMEPPIKCLSTQPCSLLVYHYQRIPRLRNLPGSEAIPSE